MKKIFLPLLLLSTLCFANEYQEWLKKEQNSYQQFKKNHDDAFADMLKKDWEAFNSMYNPTPYKAPKPKELPKVKEVIKLPQKAIEDSVIVKIVPIEKPVIHYVAPKPQPIVPPIQKEIIDPNIKKITFDFYSNTIDITYHKEIAFLQTRVNKESISDFWARFSNSNYQELLAQFEKYNRALNLNDWAKYLLIHDAGMKIYKTENMANLFTWFVLTKMHYDIKVGYNSHNIYLLSNVKHNLFQVAFFRLNNKKYYILTPLGKISNVPSIYTYQGNHEEATNALSFEFKKPILFNTNVATKELHFEYNQKKYDFTSQYSMDLVNFYKTFPQSDYQIYYDAQNSTDILNSLIIQLQTLVKNKTELEAVNLILRFVQTSFAYKTDQEQFSYEKVFFPEETLFYPYSDCEDRSILFNLLVKNVLNLDVLGLKYKDHMSSAVAFSSNVGGDGFVYEGKRFTVADPTYINANVGVSMPQYKNSSYSVIQ
ncbi:MAG: hypothetical protein ACNI3C_03420 [Candidatus Marinarcus sp.]|uniref:hypothetical protein n=1 Tax=Candidatus Marinarcus sp. TaxID=3100987 RepID=UPI003AFF8048